MILATYQSLDWKTWKNDRYSKLKEILGIPQDKNIYWCFPANTPEQALINSCCTEANQPAVFVMFKAEKYWKIDKIKWNRYVETNDENLLNEDLLNVVHSEMAEYIVTDIPEDCIEVNLTDFANSDRDLLKTIFMLSGNYENVERMVGYYFSVYEDMYKSSSVNIDGYCKEEAKETITKLFFLKKAFEDVLLTVVAMSSLKMMNVAMDYKIDEKIRIFTPPIEFHCEYANIYVKFCRDIPKITDEEAYGVFQLVQQKIFNLYFGHNYVKKIKGTVHPKMLCTCGSGKPYKKCCAKKADMPDITEVMSKGIN